MRTSAQSESAWHWPMEYRQAVPLLMAQSVAEPGVDDPEGVDVVTGAAVGGDGTVPEPPEGLDSLHVGRLEFAMQSADSVTRSHFESTHANLMSEGRFVMP